MRKAKVEKYFVIMVIIISTQYNLGYCQNILHSSTYNLIVGDKVIDSIKSLRVIDGLIDRHDKSEGEYFWHKQIIRDSILEKKYNVHRIELISFPNSQIETQVYKYVEDHFIKLKTKIPLVVDNQYINTNEGPLFLTRRKYEDIIGDLCDSTIKKIKYIDPKIAQIKYNKDLLFGVIEITTVNGRKNKH